MYELLLELRTAGRKDRQIADILNDEYGTVFTPSAIKKKVYNENKKSKVVESPKPSNSRSTTINNDGSQVSQIKIKMTAEQSKDPNYVIEAHGYDSDVWEIMSATSNLWEQNNQTDGLVQLYQSKIKVKPKKDSSVDYQKVIERINKGLKPLNIINYIHKRDSYLAVPLFDLHFGQNTVNDYQPSLDKTLVRISKGYQKIVIIVGGDLLHNDNHQGTTSSGTVIDKVDMTKAWDDAFDYIFTLINQSLSFAEEVEVLYVPGNHDEITGQTVIKALERVMINNRVTFDSRQEMFKATMLGHNFIGATHGHKASVKKYPMIYATQFSQQWGEHGVRTRELFTGHLHHELWGDLSGLFFRQAPTRNQLDQYHKDHGFVTAHSRFQLVEYNEYEPVAVYYV